MSHPVHLILSPGPRTVTRNDAMHPPARRQLRVRLDEERDALLTIKRGERPWPDINAWRLRLHKEFDEAFASTQLPERPDYAGPMSFC